MSKVNVIHRHREMSQLKFLDEGDWFIHTEELYIKIGNTNYYLGGKKKVQLTGDVWVEKVDVDIYINDRN